MADDDRRDRLAAALRANLKRRKQGMEEGNGDPPIGGNQVDADGVPGHGDAEGQRQSTNVPR